MIYRNFTDTWSLLLSLTRKRIPFGPVSSEHCDFLVELDRAFLRVRRNVHVSIFIYTLK